MTSENSALRYLFNFIEKYKLLNLSKTVAVGVSGGVDSMVLLYFMAKLLKFKKINSLRCIHINHGTREENTLEQDLVRSFCNELGIEFEVQKLELEFSSNFEAVARKMRYERFKQFLHEDEVLFLAHHIDDSFEWSLMNSSKSSQVESSIGIPLINGPVRRPFMCFSKGQLVNFSKLYKVPYLTDLSNDNTKFDRNYMRAEVIPQIKKRFPQYLKHYIGRSTQLAQKYGLSLTPYTGVKYVFDDFGGVTVFNEDYKNELFGIDEVLIDIIKLLSSSDRGSLSKEVSKLIDASNKNSNGPMVFSGDVLGFAYQGLIYLISKENLKKIHAFDDKMHDSFSKSNKSLNTAIDFNNMEAIFDYRKGQIIPNIFYSLDKMAGKKVKSSRKIDPLFPKTTKFFIDNKIWFKGSLQFLAKNRNNNQMPEVFSLHFG